MQLASLMIAMTAFGADAAQPLEIQNRYAVVTLVDGVGTFKTKVRGIPFLDQVRFGADTDGFTGAEVHPVRHATWGEGHSIVRKTPRTETRISLYEALPFVVVDQLLLNPGDSEQSVSKVQLVRGALLPGTESDQLRAASSAGLHPVTTAHASYAYMAVGDLDTHRGVVCGWLTHNRGCGVVFSDAVDGAASVRARIDYGDLRVPPGGAVKTETLLIGYADDVRRGLEQYADEIAAHYRIQLPEQPVFYMTWYNGGASNEDRIRANAAFVQEHLAPYGLRVMQIDDHWQAGVSNNGPRRNFTQVGPPDYKSGMKTTADRLHAMGLTPGIWYMPFAGTWNDPFWADKQDLFLKQGASTDNYHGEVCRKVKGGPTYAKPEDTPFESRWGGTSLDLTNPKALEYVHTIADLLGNQWGYKFFKMDGLWTGTGTKLLYVNSAYQDDNLGMPLRRNPVITPIEAYRNGLKTVREATRGEVFLLGCSSTQNMRSYGASFGLVDAMRVGPDNGAGRNPQHIVRAVAFASRNFWQEERVWFVDPDSFSIRDSVDLVMPRSYLSWITLCGMLNNTSVNYPDLSPERLHVLRRTMPSHRLKTVNPVDFLENEPAKVWTLKDCQAGPERTVVGLFSWDAEKSVTFDVPLDKLGLDAGREHVGFDYWGDGFLSPFKASLADVVNPMDCRIVSLKPVADHPQVLGTSRHITQGSVDLLEESWDDTTSTLSGRSRMVAGDPYELRIAVPWQDESFKAVGAKCAGMKATVTQDGPQVRIAFHPERSGEAAWSVTFQKGRLDARRPEPVRDLAAEASYTAVSLTWEPAGNTDLVLVRSGDGRTVRTKLGGVTQYRDVAVELGCTYTYRLTSRNWLGEESEPATVVAKMPNRLVRPPVPPQPDICLTDLKWRKATSGWGSVRVNACVTGNTLTLDGRTYEKGIGTHAKSVLVYDIPKGVTRFVALVGVDDRMRDRTEGATVACRVTGSVREMGEDPVVLGESPLLSAETLHTWAFDVKLDPRLKEIRLEADEATKGVNSDHVNWCNAGFVTAKP